MASVQHKIQLNTLLLSMLLLWKRYWNKKPTEISSKNACLWLSKWNRVRMFVTSMNGLEETYKFQCDAVCSYIKTVKHQMHCSRMRSLNFKNFKNRQSFSLEQWKLKALHLLSYCKRCLEYGYVFNLTLCCILAIKINFQICKSGQIWIKCYY